MQITKKEDHYLFENEQGSYHLMINKYNKLGRDKAIEFVESEIKKKSRHFTGDRINFKIARRLGFCEYGINDFCEKLELDTGKTYKVDEVRELLTKDVILEYHNECFKIFGSSMLDKFGGAKRFLEDNREKNVLHFVLTNMLPEIEMHKLSVKFAYRCIDCFEKEYPDDDRSRKAIEYKEAWIRGDITDEQLRSAESAAESAARSAESAARSAARSAASAARSAAWSTESAAWSARSAASAAWSAAWSTESAAIEWQINETLKVM